MATGLALARRGGPGPKVIGIDGDGPLLVVAVEDEAVSTALARLLDLLALQPAEAFEHVPGLGSSQARRERTRP